MITRKTAARIAAVASAAAVALAMSGCANTAAGAGGASAGNGGQIRVGAIYLDAQGYYGGVKAGVTAAAKKSGMDVKFIETNPGGDVSKESQFMDTLVSSRVSAIIISAASADSSVPAIKQAHDAGIPVICYNTCVNDAATKKYVTAYVVGDPISFGTKIGEAAVEDLKSRKVADPKIGVINCEQYEVCKQRLSGFTAAVKKAFPNAAIVANQEGAVVDKAVPTAQQMLTAHPEINAMFGEAGGATIGAYKSVQSANKVGDIGVYGSDMTTEIATELKAGSVLKAVVDISGLEVGNLAWTQVEKALKDPKAIGETVQAPITVYTPDDAAKWLSTHTDGLP